MKVNGVREFPNEAERWFANEAVVAAKGWSIAGHITS
jgi:hypothetical protein